MVMLYEFFYVLKLNKTGNWDGENRGLGPVANGVAGESLSSEVTFGERFDRGTQTFEKVLQIEVWQV